MKHALIFHGTGGHPEENWFPWLKSELKQRGYAVEVPHFPTPEGQSLESWLNVLANYPNHWSKDSIVIGHSLGGLFLLRALEQAKSPIKAAFFVGAPVGMRPIKFYESDQAFSGFDFDWKTIRQNASHFEVWQSDNDPYVSLSNGQKLAKELGVDLNFVADAGHFNAAAGFDTFPALLNKIIRFDKAA